MTYNFEKVVPIYTGGNIYCYYGKTDKDYFICSDEYWLNFVDYIPFDDEKVVNDEMWFNEWLDCHTIRTPIDDKEVNEFCIQMLKWVINEDETNGHIEGGNYDAYDLENHLEWLKEQE